MGYSKEKLLENLPDYINNKIEDNELSAAISAELLSNPDFKNEYDLINSTFESINRVEFAEPPFNYFNNLLPNINEKIHQKAGKSNYIKNFAKLWKYAVPVAAVILFFIGYKIIFKNNEYMNNLNSDSQFVMKEFNYSDKNKMDSFKESEEITATENTEEVNVDNKSISLNNLQISEKRKMKQKRESIDVLLDFSDNASEEEVFFSNDDEINYEQDFEKMSNEEQNNIILKIKNSNL